MGRPLNKKYFDPIPTSNGEGVASITIDDGGTYTSIPVPTIASPVLPNGVTAILGDVHMTGLSATITTSGTGDVTKDYVPGDKLTVVGGTAATVTVFNVDSVKIRTAANVADAGGFVNGDTVTFSTGWSTPAVLTLTVVAGAITGISITNPGVRTTTPLPTDPVTPDSTNGGGTLAETTFNLGFGVNAVSIDTAGDYTALPANPVVTTTDSAQGTGATLTVSYQVSAIDVDDAGSGYIQAPTISFSAGSAAASAVLTSTGTDVILAHARIVGSASVLDADIKKQTSTNEYLMETTDGESVCSLVATDSLLAGQAYIKATDSLGSTYFVTKLTAHLAVLQQWNNVGGFVYLNGEQSAWTLLNTNIDPTGQTVQIESA